MTSTRVLLTDANGQCLGYGDGGRGNPICAGADRAASAGADRAGDGVPADALDLRTVADSAVGAAVLTLRAVGSTAYDAVLARLRASAAAFR